MDRGGQNWGEGDALFWGAELTQGRRKGLLWATGAAREGEEGGRVPSGIPKPLAPEGEL